MEVEKTEIAKQRNAGELREGDVVRVRVIGKSGKDRFLVDIRGRVFTARLSGMIGSSLFIARVARASPRIDLKFLRSLEKSGSPIKLDQLEELLQVKKEVIQKLYVTDTMFVARVLSQPIHATAIRKALQRGIRDQNIRHFMNGKKPLSSKVTEYYLLQNLANLIRSNTFSFLFPLTLERRRFICDLQLFGGRDVENRAIYLSLSFEDGRTMGFLVFLDHELIKCTVSSNDSGIESALRHHAGRLVENLRSTGYNRNVFVDFVPFTEHRLFSSTMMKKIDIKM